MFDIRRLLNCKEMRVHVYVRKMCVFLLLYSEHVCVYILLNGGCVVVCFAMLGLEGVERQHTDTCGMDTIILTLYPGLVQLICKYTH